MTSVIYLTETVRNEDRRFGSADAYVPVRVVYADGTDQIALFTPSEIGAATVRGEANREDAERFRHRMAWADVGRAGYIVLGALLLVLGTWALLS